jgi:hypothetical protein
MSAAKANGRRRRFSIPGQFVPFRVEMLESAAWAALSLADRRVLGRLCIEHAHHGGTENGRLICTYDFERFGVRRKSIAGSVRRLGQLGFLEITELGRGGNAEWRRPTRYRLTFVHTAAANPTDEWKLRAPPPADAPATSSAPSRDIDSRGGDATEACRGAGAAEEFAFSGAEPPPVSGAETPPGSQIREGTAVKFAVLRDGVPTRWGFADRWASGEPVRPRLPLL